MLNFFIYIVGGIIIGLILGFMTLVAAAFLLRYVDEFQDEAKVEEEPNPRKATFVSTTQDAPSGMKEFLERNKK